MTGNEKFDNDNGRVGAKLMQRENLRKEIINDIAKIKLHNPSDRQCEIARAMTKSNASDEQITKELSTMTANEWEEQCRILDKALVEHNMPFDKGWNIMCADFINIGAANSVDEATVFVAYMDLKSQHII